MNPTLYATRDDGAELWDTGTPSAFPGEPGYGFIVLDGKRYDPRPILALTAQGSWTLAPGVESKREYVRDADGQFAHVPGSVGRHEVVDFIQQTPSSPTPVNLSGIKIRGVSHPEVFVRNLGIPREQMPQVPNTHKATFLDELRGEGIPIARRSFDPLALHPTQSQIDARRVAEFFPLDPALTEQNPIMVSSDGYVLDGHHRWAAAAAEAANHPGRTIAGVQVGLPIRALLARAEAFNSEQAIVGRAFGDKAAFATAEEKAAVIEEYKASRHLVQHHGGWLWAGRPGGSGEIRNTARVAEVVGALTADKDKPDIINLTDPLGMPLTVTKADSMWHHLERQPDGSWGFSEERMRLHRRLIQDAIRDVPVSDNPTQYMLGGGTAAGKSTMLSSGDIEVPSTGENGTPRLAVLVNPDDIKPQLPEYGNGGKTAAKFTHEESSWVSKLITGVAQKGKRDIVVDGTGDSSVQSLSTKIGQARDAGYRVEGFYATVPTDVAWQRSEARAAETGRHVPESTLRQIHASVSRTFPLAHDLFDEVRLYNTENGPHLIAHGTRGQPLSIVDQRAYADFVAKGNE